MIPSKVNFNNAGIVFDTLFGKYYENKLYQPSHPMFKLNQKVRVVLKRNVFAKGNLTKISAAKNTLFNF